MDEHEKIIWTAVGSLAVVLISAIILGISKRLREKGKDAVSVIGDVSVMDSLELTSRFGCRGILLKVRCGSKRPARIEGARLTLRNPSQEFRVGPKPLGRRAVQSFSLNFQPFSPPTRKGMWVLERDDTCKFFLPVDTPGLKSFVNAPSENVKVDVAFSSGATQKVASGLKIIQLIEVAQGATPRGVSR